MAPEITQRDSGLYAPGTVNEANEEWTEAQESSSKAIAFRRLLKEVDPRLDLLWVKENAEFFPIACRWYIVRWNENVDASYWVIQTDDGEYSDPEMEHFNRLRQNDTANVDVWEEYQKARVSREKSSANRLEELRREFREKLTERLDHIYNASVPITNKPKSMQSNKSALKGIASA